MSSAPTNEATPAAAARRPSLTLRLTLWYGLFVLAVGAIAVALTHEWIDAHREAAHQRQLVRAIETHAFLVERAGVEGLRTTYARLGLLEESVYVRLRDHQGATLFEHRPELLAPPSLDPERGETLFARQQDDEGTRWYFASRRVERGVVDLGRDAIGEEARTRIQALTVAGAVVAILFLLGGYFVVRRGLAPVRQLGRTMRRALASGDLGERVPVRERGDELDELGALFNRLLGRNERLLRSLRGALDDVAHDLRTPLTRLRARAELGLTEADSDPREALADVVEETDRVLQTLRAITDVSEAEAGVMKLTNEAVDLRVVVEQVVDLYEMVAEDAQIEIEASTEGDVVVRGDEARLRQAVANLMDNAIKYSETGGKVRIGARSEGDHVVVEVADEGIGIESDALPRVFDRLYRADPSRGERGLGLGLSLVRAIAHAHGGEVSAESEPGEGSRFVLRLPRSTES